MALLQRAVDSARGESRLAAARLDAIAEFVHDAIRADGGVTDSWFCDAVGAATIDIAAALRVSRGAAEWQVRYAYDMAHRLPLLAARFRDGDITECTFRTAAFRTGLILDDHVLARVDAILARRIPRWGPVARSEMHTRIDKIVGHVDADAVRRRKDERPEPGVTITPLTHGMSELTVVTTAVNAAATSARVTALAHSVCENDPRTLAERRAHAHDAAVQGARRLSCRCGRDDCPAGGIVIGPTVIHVLADPPSLTPPPVPEIDDENASDNAPTDCSSESGDSTDVSDEPEPDPVEPDPEGSGPVAATGAIVSGYDGLFPPEMIAEIVAEARIRYVVHPGDAPPESGYRPSAALAEFIRARDLHCRFPNCEVPARDCDIDHVIPHGDGGPTQASNLSCKCRTHHLAKTFWGWQEKQDTDGTITWTSPSGWVSVTHPAGAALYPFLAAPTAPVTPPPAGTRREQPAKGVKMPRRQRTRTQQRSATITAERRANHTARTDSRLHEYDEDYTYDETFLEDQRAMPPPF